MDRMKNQLRSPDEIRRYIETAQKLYTVKGEVRVDPPSRNEKDLQQSVEYWGGSGDEDFEGMFVQAWVWVSKREAGWE